MKRIDASKTATKVRDLPHWGAPATLYRLATPHGVFANFVVAHIGCDEGLYGQGKPKLRVFGCEPNGEINSICEISAPTARYRGHKAALRTAGYHLAGR